MSWQSTFLEYDKWQRQDLRRSLLNDFRKNHGPFVKFVESSCDFVGFSPGLDIIKKSSSKVTMEKFSEPCLLYYVRNQPLLIVLKTTTKKSSLTVSAKQYVNQKRRVMGYDSDSRYLEWVIAFANSNAKTKEEYKELLLTQGISKQKSGDKLVEFLLKSADVNFDGFAITMNYYKEKGLGDEMFAEFEHPFGGATLVYNLKTIPAYLVTNPTLRFNTSYIKEERMNNYSGQIAGITD